MSTDDSETEEYELWTRRETLQTGGAGAAAMAYPMSHSTGGGDEGVLASLKSKLSGDPDLVVLHNGEVVTEDPKELNFEGSAIKEVTEVNDYDGLVRVTLEGGSGLWTENADGSVSPTTADESVSINHLHTDSREANVVVKTRNGTVYAEDDTGILASGDATVTSDVETVLQAAFDAGGVIVSDGEPLTVANATTVKSNTTLRGFHIEGSDSGRILELGTDVTDITIENCTFDGGHGDTVTTADTLQDPLIDSASENDTGPYNDTDITFRGNEIRNHAGVALDFDVVADSRVTLNYVHNVYAGISFQTRNSVCSHNVVVGTADIGIDCGTSTSSNQALRWNISNNIVFDTTSHGINVFGNPAKGTISDNIVVPNTAGDGGTSHGITVIDHDFGGGTVSPYRVDISDNYVESCDIHGIIIEAVDTGLPTGISNADITAEDNDIQTVDSHGITVLAGTGIEVQDNFVRNAYNGYNAESSADVQIEGNKARACQNGVRLGDASSYKVVGNDIPDGVLNPTNGDYCHDNTPTVALDVRSLKGETGNKAYHDGTNANTVGPAVYRGSVPEWTSLVDGTTIS